MNIQNIPARGVVVLAALFFLNTLSMAQPAKADKVPDVAQFARGAKTWAANCGRCHNLRDASELRDDQWRVVMTHMRIRAGLTGSEARDILAFLQGSN